MEIRGRRIPMGWLAVSLIIVLVIGAITILALSPGGSVLGQSFSIGYVDMARAVDSHPRRQASERALQEFFQAKQREFQQRARGLNAVQRQELDRQLQQQFIQKREELIGGLDKDIRGTIETVAKERGVSIVLDRNVVLYGGTDLTDAVIGKLTAK
ncbi:MAG: OmpH family outer membrane protein [Armatimonadetes bacterium]|nr:OmpH family outer membrane protein [Armatimonadota bacterium]MBI2246788.1 OmpH family outer membrane protein [Armatimonadota bacterium]